MRGDGIRFYRVGGVSFALDSPGFDETDALAKFRVEPCEADAAFTVQLVPEVEAPEGEVLYNDGCRATYRTQNGVSRVLFDERDGTVLMTDTPNGREHSIRFRADRAGYFSANLALKLLDLPREMLFHGGVFLHASFIGLDGEAILFTGRRQIGKSTQAELWKRHRGAEIINGDRAILRRCGDRWFAWGSPYCGTSGICEKSALPVRAVVVLSQGEENAAQRAGVRCALRALLDGGSFDTWDGEQVRLAADICGDIAAQVPFYTLACTPDERAVKALEEVL